MEEKKVAKTASKTTAKTAAKTTKTTSKATSTKSALKKTTTTRRKKADIEDIESIESIEDEEVANQIKRRRKVDEKSFNTGLSLGAKIAIVVVIAVIIILLLLKGCKNKGEYTVKFNSNGGNEISEQVVKANEKVSAPTDPTKDGYKFVGWYVDGKRFDFDTKITKDIVIEAKWESEGNAEVSGITLDQKELAILPGDTVPLVATVEPEDAKDKTVKWTSSDESVATVDENGKVTAKAVGSATITVTTNEKEFTATCRVVVSDNVVKVTGIKLSTNKLDISVGDAERVTAEVSPANATNKGITWKSSDSSIASVSTTGVIRGVSDGDATITATTKDGEFKSEVSVHVEKVNAKEIKVQEKNMKVGIGKTVQIDYTVVPVNAAEKTVTWSSNNSGVAEVNSKGQITGKSAGTAVITGKLKTDEKELTVTINVEVTKPIAVTGVKINGCPSKLEVGQTTTLSVVVSPNNAVNKKYKWDTSQVNNAFTISNGKVTAKNIGTGKVSVKTDDGGFTAECTIEVIKAAEKASDYTITFTANKVGEQITSYSVAVTKKGAAVNSYNLIRYGDARIHPGETLSADDYNGASTATLKLDAETTLDGVRVVVK